MQLHLDSLPVAATSRSVIADPAKTAGRESLRVELTAEASAGEAGVDYVDQPTFVELPIPFRTGVISVDIFSAFNGLRSDSARGFAGLAYRVSPGSGSFECVYVRPANGMKHDPPAPRNVRAVQYFAYPNWKFDRLREEHPGEFEAGANIAMEEWLQLEVRVSDNTAIVKVNGLEVLAVKSKLPPQAGNIGLFVDIGTVAYFSNLRVEPA